MTETQLPCTAGAAMAQVGPSAALAFLATSPLIAGEDAAAYDDLSARMSRMLTPSDILEQIWVRDVVDLTWETLRLRRLKAQFLTATAHEGLAMVLGPLLGAKTSDQVAPRWAARDAQALVQVDAVLAAAGLDMDAAMARTFALKIDTVERIERMAAGAHYRRSDVLREIERHRASFATTLRRAVAEVEDAALTDVAASASVARARTASRRHDRARRLVANRANARRSRGPITAAGRARAAQNARRHGLSRPVRNDPAYAGDIAALAREIAGADAGAERLALAGCIAAAQVDLMRVRRARRDGMCDSMCDSMAAASAMRVRSRGSPPSMTMSGARCRGANSPSARSTRRRRDRAAPVLGKRTHVAPLQQPPTSAARPCTQAAKARHRAREATLRRPGAGPTLRAETMRSCHEVRPRREDNMTKSNATTRGVSRRRFIAGTAGAGAALASNLAAPGLLAQTRAPIKLGNLNSFTGAIAYAAENNLNGMNLFFDSVGWTVGGRKIEIIKEDDQFNPQVGLQKAKKLVESDKVDMIVGVQASNVALAVLNYAKQQKAFYVVSGAGTDAITWDRYPYLFRTSISAYQLSTPMANWVYDNLGKEIVTTASDYAGGRDVIAQFKGPYVARGGKVLKEIWPPLGTTDFSPYLIDIKSINPPVTYDFMPGADAIRFIQQYTEFGLKEKMPLTGFTIIDSLTISALGKAALGVISATTYTDTVDNPQSKQFVTDYQAKYKALPDIFSDYGYVAARAVYEALKAIDGDASNKDKLSEAMTKIKFDAPRGPFRMDPVTHNPIEDIHICQVIEKDGKVTSKVITTFKDVQDPGKKIY